MLQLRPEIRRFFYIGLAIWRDFPLIKGSIPASF